MIKRIHLPRLLLLTVGLTSSTEYFFLKHTPEHKKEVIRYIEQAKTPVIENKLLNIRLTPKNASNIFKKHSLFWCEKQLKRQGYKKINTGDVLQVSVRIEDGKSTAQEAVCYTANDWGYKILPKEKAVHQFRLKRTEKAISVPFVKTFSHTLAPYKLQKSIEREALRAISSVINPKTCLQKGSTLRLAYSTVVLPDGTSFNTRLNYAGVAGKKSVNVFIFSSGKEKGLYDATGSLCASSSLRTPMRGRIRIGDGFGYRKDPFTRMRRFHKGVDFPAPRGTSVYSAGKGKVTFCGSYAGYGKMIEVTHTGTTRTRYAHLHHIKTRLGQTVDTGTVLGTIGSSGRSTGPHLHYEVLKCGKQVNPMKFCKLEATKLTGKALTAFNVFKARCLKSFK